MATEPPKPNIDVGRVVSRGFTALKANFLPFFGFALVLAGAPAFLQSWYTSSMQQDVLTGRFDPGSFFGALLLALFTTILGFALLQGAITRATIRQLGGRDSDPAGSAVHALKQLLPLIGIGICVGLMLVVGLIALIVPGIMVWCACAVAVPALVEERRGVFGSIQRSWDLTRGSRGQIFLIGLLFYVFQVVVGAIAGIFTGASMIQTGGALPDPLFLGIGNGLASSLTNTISAVLLATLYVELREVKEGASTELLADVFG
ncbi:MAG: hypothetical protein JO276_07155 [Sphingomonadaceae bacterium]|nr:hypothetical protein [Sphingomonadaceae bacterium]